MKGAIPILRLAALACIAAGGISLPAPALAPPQPLEWEHRAARLEAYFRSHGCPAPYYVDDYLLAADLNHLDYRVLPAVSMRESTCGVYARLNNRWGWDSARTGFRSVARGIHFIAHQLAFGRCYRGKEIDEKLRVYNPKNPQYASEVKRLMREIDGD